jgi:uncharacterized protein YbjT (DUF2867 family)
MTVLVTGATGTVGRHLISLLDGPVRAVSRDPHADLGPHDAEHRVSVVDNDPMHLVGVTALFVHPRAVADPATLVARARAAGVGKVVALSASNVDDDPADQPSRHRGDRNKEAEDAVAGGGLPWVSVRAGSFAGNTATAWAHQIRAGDVVHGPYADFAEAPFAHALMARYARGAGLPATVTGEVDKILRRPARTYPDWVADHLDMFTGDHS